MSLLWPLLLILAGGVLLLNNLGYLDWGIWAGLWRLWPLILVILGLDMLLSRRNPVLSAIIALVVLAGGIAIIYSMGLHPIGNSWASVGPPRNMGMGSVVQMPLHIPVQRAEVTRLRIDFGAGRLRVDGIPQSTDTLATGTLEYFSNGSPPDIEIETNIDGTYVVHLRQWSGRGDGFPDFDFGMRMRDRLDWTVHLNRDVPLELEVNAGASQGELDLRDLRDLRLLELNMGASHTTVQFPAQLQHDVSAHIEAGAATLQLVIPEGVAARIDTDSSVAAALNIDRHFVEKGDGVYESPDYGKAEHHLNIDLDMGAGDATITSR
jgi:hypothetical protein